MYEDKNGNGVLDGGDVGISGVTLTLSGTNGQGQAITDTITTGSGGTYTFTTSSGGSSLLPGTYQIVETMPSGYLAGAANVGTVNSSSDGAVVSATDIGSIVTTSGQTGINYNFGNVKPVTIGGTVYEDKNDNGALDSGEPGISGVTVTLSGTNNQGKPITATTTTSSTGTYSFTTDSSGNKLAPGTYTITETLPSGYLSRAANVGTVNSAADGTASSATAIGSIVLVDGQAGVSYNFGNVKPVTIGGEVYEDKNDNGVLDSGDVGIAGVTLTLSGTTDLGASITATATTGSGGTYSFTTDSNGNAIRPGTYQIVETLPSGYISRAATVGTVNSTSDGSVVSATDIGSIVLGDGQAGINYYFGDVKAVTLSGLVYQDTTDSGVYSSSNDAGIAGVTLTLSGTNDLGASITATATTGSGGTFSFTTDSNGNAIRPGTYAVTETLPSGYLAVSAAVGTVNGSADGSVVSSTKIGSVVMAEGQNGSNYYFGNVQPVTVSGLVYQDMNGSGVYSSSDLGIAGVTVTLSGTNGQGQSITATTTTASGGTYSFSTDSNGNALRPGTYQIVETQPTGYFLGAAAVGTVNGTADGTVSSATKIISVALTSGQSGIYYLFGDVKGVSISGTVYQDIPGNGTYSSNDPGVAGVTLTLTGTNNLGQSITATTVSGANGTYTFNTDSNGNPLRPGTYQVTETMPSGYLPGSNFVGKLIGTPDNFAQGFTQALSGSGPGYTHNSADDLFTTGSKDTLGITSGWSWTTGSVPQKDLLEDGFASTYNDPSGNELLLASADRYAANGDSTIGFWFLQNPLSLNANGTFNGSHTTGDILITNDFASGSVGTLGVYEWIGADGSGTLQQLTVPAGAAYFFVNSSPFSVPWSFTDSSGSTSPQAGEYMAIGVDLNALLGSSVPHFTSTLVESRASTSTTAELKSFILGGINSVIGTNQPDGTLVGTNAIGSIVTTSGVTGINYNFGLVKPVTVSGLVYQDTNGTGAYVSSDPGIGGVTLTLTGTNNLGSAVTATTTTAANGTYSFTTDNNGNQIRPGTYQIVETPPSSYLPGTTSVGTVNGTTDGTVVTSGTIGSIVETSGQNGINYLFGEVKPDTISGLVYVDTNGTGTYVSADSGIAGVTLTLTGTNNLGQSITATVVTGANGTYSFTTDSNGNQIRPGTYTITETLPSGYIVGAATVGTVNGTADGTAVSATQIGSASLSSGQSGINYNFGDLKPVTVSGTVYEDKNDSGALVSGDPGISGVTPRR